MSFEPTTDLLQYSNKYFSFLKFHKNLQKPDGRRNDEKVLNESLEFPFATPRLKNII